jgi:hypothetical protein
MVKQETRELRAAFEVMTARMNRGALYHRAHSPVGVNGWVQHQLEKYFGNICFETQGLTLETLMERMHIPVNEISMKQTAKALAEEGYEPMGDFYYFHDPEDDNQDKL